MTRIGADPFFAFGAVSGSSHEAHEQARRSKNLRHQRHLRLKTVWSRRLVLFSRSRRARILFCCMNIGITVYPTYGGSGIVGSELGRDLAERGHNVHFISSVLPTRVTELNDRVHFHEVEMMSYPLFEHQPYDLALATKMATVARAEKLDLLHVHYAIPHSISAIKIEGLTPLIQFQDRIFKSEDRQTPGLVSLEKVNGKAMILDFGKQLRTMYVYLRDDDQKVRKAVLEYTMNDKRLTLSDARYPFEFTIPFPEKSRKPKFVISVTDRKGKVTTENIVFDQD